MKWVQKSVLMVPQTYEYWSNDVAKFLSDELPSSEFLLNLSSNEYFSAIDKSKINSEIISLFLKISKMENSK